jgi:hypothetical protein
MLPDALACHQVVVYFVRMDTRAAAVATKVAQAIDSLGVAPETVAHAADITVAELNDRLALRAEFRMFELLGVGGVLRIHPAELIGAAA